MTEGDRVGGYIPNCPEAIEAMAATAALGAVWSSTSPDFGVSGVLDRFSQIRPKVVFSVEAVSYNMKTHDHLAKLSQVVNKLESVERVVVIPFIHEKENIDLSQIKNSMFLDDFLDLGRNEDGSYPELVYKQVPFSHPLFIMYSSGTTGAPKCMVHSVGGTLIKHLEEHVVQGNRDASDTLLYYTTTGWMMWNWEVSVLATGCSLVLYDGSPLHPHNAVLWDLVDRCGITVFGTSAKWIAVQEDRGLKPRVSHNLSTLRAICSTGSPLTPKSYDYVYRDIKANVLLASISGGTDIIACFMGENSVLPVYRGEIQSAHLGCGVQAWDEEGRAVTGEAGELVCTAPFPSMPVRFWNDESGEKYHGAYFAKYPGIWAHGDFMLVSPKTGGIHMLGRSDGTLNPSGVRFGSAEIYNIVEEFPEVDQCTPEIVGYFIFYIDQRQSVCGTEEPGQVGGESDPLPQDGHGGDEPRAGQAARLHSQDPALRPPRARPHPPHRRDPLHHQRQEGRGRRQEDPGGRGGEEQERSRQPRLSRTLQEYSSNIGLVN